MAPIAGHGKAFVEDGKLIGFLGDGEYLWHTDMSYVEVPPKASCLYSIEVPDAEGDAGFPNMPVTYNPLPYDVKRRIEGLTINHETRYTIVWFCRIGGPSLEAVKAAGILDVTRLPGINHPIVREHPETGRKAQYLGRRKRITNASLSVCLAEFECLPQSAEAANSTPLHSRCDTV